MASEEAREKKRRGQTDVVCLDFGQSAVKAVRLRRARDQVVVVGAEILPPALSDGEAGARAARLDLSTALRAKYAFCTLNTPRTLLRLLNMPGRAESAAGMKQQIQKQFSLGEGYRVGHIALPGAGGRPGNRIVAVAVPETDVQQVLRLLATGAPAAYSLELSGLSALSAVLLGAGGAGEEAFCFVEGGARNIFLYFVNKGGVVLLRKYDAGALMLAERLVEDLGVDQEMAMGILSEGAIDVAASVQDVLGFVFKQLAISRDFVERQENCRIARVCLSGGLALSGVWRQQIKDLTGLPVTVWNPFEGLQVAPGALPESLQGQETRCTAAVGAALGAWQTP